MKPGSGEITVSYYFTVIVNVLTIFSCEHGLLVFSFLLCCTHENTSFLLYLIDNESYVNICIKSYNISY